MRDAPTPNRPCQTQRVAETSAGSGNDSCFLLFESFRSRSTESFPRFRFFGRQLAYIDILKPKRPAMVLQLDLPARINWFVAFPIIFQCRRPHDEFAIEENVDLFSSHDDAEAVPLADRLVSDLEWVSRVPRLFVIVEAAGAVRRVKVPGTFRVPNLDLRAAAQIYPTVAARRNLPIHQHLEVGIILFGAEAVAFAVESDFAILCFP